MQNCVLETERMILRECQFEDASFIYQLFTQPECLRFIGDRGITDLDTARDYIRDNLRASYEKNGYGLYVMQCRKSGESLGLCGLVKRDYLPVPDLGFAVLNAYTRKGLTREACIAMLKYSQVEFEYPELLAITKPENIASMALLEGLGFKAVDSLYKEHALPADTRVFAIELSEEQAA